MAYPRSTSSPTTRGRGPVIGVIAVAVTLAVAACQQDGGGASGNAGGTQAPAGSGAAAAEYPTADISIMAPADPGGGWDSTARAMQAALQDGVIEQNVEVYNVGGAAGTIGLAQFAGEAGDPHQLMVMGLVMVGGIMTNESAVDLSQVTPIASLTTEWEAVAVAADSEYETFEQLIEDFKADPGSISWGGGSAGGTDHILVGMIAQAAEVDPAQINYIANAGGGELVPAVISGGVTVGVSGASEFADQVAAGEMRYLAISSEEPVEGIEAPTIIESGLDVTISNWRGVMAPPDISDADRAGIIAMIERMHESEGWQTALEENGWTDFFQTGDEYAAFLADEEERVAEVLQEIGLVEG